MANAMKKQEQIVNFLKQKYQPIAFVLYGSFAEGTENEQSDFDAILIYQGEDVHENSFFETTQLDVFCYSKKSMEKDFEPQNFPQLYGAKILIDTEGLAKGLQEQVEEWIQSQTRKSLLELEFEVNWCEKMLVRAYREDAEGFFRRYWLLVDSLQIYMDILGEYYFGSKKALKFLAEKEETAYFIYEQALKDNSLLSLERWINYIKQSLEKRKQIL